MPWRSRGLCRKGLVLGRHVCRDFFLSVFYLVSLLPFSLSDMAAFLYVGSRVRKDQKTVPSTTAVDIKPRDVEPPQSSSEYRQELRPKIHSGTWLPQ